MGLFGSKTSKVKFDSHSIYNGHLKTTYRGIRAIRCPFDYVIYQMILWDIQPDLVIEIGTNLGGGSLYIADILSIIGNGVVHSIDIENHAEKIVKEHPRIRFFFDSYEKYNLDNANGFSKIMVIEDGSHNYKDTLNALMKFQDIVTVGSYFIIEDGIISHLGMDKRFDGGPLRAINEFLKQNKRYAVDRKWCDYYGLNATFNVNGYLKKTT